MPIWRPAEGFALIALVCRKANDPTETNIDSESPTTPTKASARPSGGRNILGGGRGLRANARSGTEEEDVDEEDAEEVATMIGSDGSSPPPIGVSSDDFGGYD